MSISLSNVTKYFGKVKAVSSLNLEIGDGECFSMLGPSGCGKTTTLRMVAGFEDLDEGEISVNGKLLSSGSKKYYLPPEKRDFGMVFQAFAVWPHMSVYENVAFPLRIKKSARQSCTNVPQRPCSTPICLRWRKKVRRTSPAAASSAWLWPGHSPSTPQSCCWTNRSQALTRICARRCALKSRSCKRFTGFPSCTSPTTRRKPWRSLTAFW